MYINKFYFPFILILFFFEGKAQSFSPKRDYGVGEVTLVIINKTYDSLVSASAVKDKKINAEILYDYSNLKSYLYNLDTAKYLMAHDTISDFINGVVFKIQQKNELLKNRRLNVFVKRTESPNAANLGGGVVLVNLGILRKIENEEQLAFILCHEMAHDILQHVNKKIVSKAHLMHDVAVNKQLNDLSKEEFGVAKKADALLSRIFADVTQNSREFELQADSLGLVLYLNAGYPAQEALKSMNTLDSIDQFYFTDAIDIEQFFTFPTMTFDKDLLLNSDYLDLGTNLDNIEIPDSLKTHPDCKIRYEAMEHVIGSYKSHDITAKTNNYLFDNLKHLSSYYLLDLALQNENYSYALYSAIQMLKIYPSDIYLKTSVLLCLKKINKALLAHRFSEVVALPDRHLPLAYNNLLVFLHNLSGSEFNRFADNYLVQRFSVDETDSYFKSVKNLGNAKFDK